ncbi:MAG: ATP-binding cassette domain-containing protein [Saprospirales bacterium]|nr:MAG: ATP-binding cassette domain-containing protein [Saprospirales bacterium]
MPDRIELEKIGLNYGASVVLNSVNLTLTNPSVTGIAGPNGSGKSTMLKIISGNLSPSRGKIIFHSGSNEIPDENIFEHLSFSAPYIDLPEALKLGEFFSFCGNLKKWKGGLNTGQVLKMSGLERFEKRKISNFSSGMKQRAKLTAAILQDTSLLILDEPGTNLDTKAKSWMYKLLKRYLDDRIVIIASNEGSDLEHCSRIIQLPS